MIPGADARILVYFDGRVACIFCPCDGSECFSCDGTGVMDTLESVDREDVETVRFLDGATC